MKMSKNQKLDDLFKKWSDETQFSNGNFFRDGIINEDSYNKQKKRILFIAKEPNYENHTDKIKDFRIQWNNAMPDYKIAKRIAILSHGILNDFPAYNTIKPSNEDLKKIAFMNIKKSSGGSVSKFVDFEEFVKTKKFIEYIRNEIEIIQPDLILLGLTWDTVRNKIFHDCKWEESGLGVEYTKINRTTIIDYYHPSSMIPANVDYYYLKTVLEKIL